MRRAAGVVVVLWIGIGCGGPAAGPDAASSDGGRAWSDPYRDAGPPLEASLRCPHVGDGITEAWLPLSEDRTAEVGPVAPHITVAAMPDGRPLVGWREDQWASRGLTGGVTSPVLDDGWWSIALVAAPTSAGFDLVRPSVVVRGSAVFVFGAEESVSDAVMIDPSAGSVRARYALDVAFGTDFGDEVLAAARTRSGFVVLTGPALALYRLDETMEPLEPPEHLDLEGSDVVIVPTRDGASLALWGNGAAAMPLDADGRIAGDPIGRAHRDWYPDARTTHTFDGARVITTWIGESTSGLTERDERGVEAGTTRADDGITFHVAFGTADGLVVLAQRPDESPMIALVERGSGRVLTVLHTSPVTVARPRIASAGVVVETDRARFFWTSAMSGRLDVVELPCAP